MKFIRVLIPLAGHYARVSTGLPLITRDFRIPFSVISIVSSPLLSILKIQNCSAKVNW